MPTTHLLVRFYFALLLLLAPTAAQGDTAASPHGDSPSLALLLSGNEVKLTASDADINAPSMLGWSVAISGDTAVAGGRYDDNSGASQAGAAYVYQRDVGGADNWGEVKKLIASDADNGDRSGESVAISGDLVIVGAPYNEDAGNDTGSAYVFERDAGGPNNWGQVKKLLASDADTGMQFGISVAIDGDTAMVGAWGDSAVYVYQQNEGGAGNWGEVKKLTASDPGSDGSFGGSVALSGDTAIIGAQDAGGSGNNFGGAYIVERDRGGADNWGEVKKIFASDADPGDYDYFGESVAISGETAVVGASGRNPWGAAYVFDRDSGGLDNWGAVAKLSPPTDGFDRFGESVGISDDTAIVGERDDAGPSGTEWSRGAAYVFGRDQGGVSNWGMVEKLIATDGGMDDNFGDSVAISGGVAIVGAPYDDNGNGPGSAYVYFEVQCGDGEIGSGEECDDGNSEDGDCCSATCLYEDPGTECGDGNACTGADVCDAEGVCAAGGPSSTCIGGFAKAMLLVNEKRAGKEKVIVKLKNGPDIALADFGFQAPPLVMSPTMYSLCIFDDADNLVAGLEARRVLGSECAGKQCWSSRSLGWLYKDKAAAYDGVQQIKLKGGPAGKTQVQVKAGNNEPKGQMALPTGIAAQLTTTTNAKVQVVSTDAACFEAVVDQVKKQDTYLFKAIKK